MIINCVKKFTLVKTKLRTPMAGLRQYFKPTTLLPTASETGIGELATTAANEAVAKVIELGAGTCSSCSLKCKAYTAFTKEQVCCTYYFCCCNNSININKLTILVSEENA